MRLTEKSSVVNRCGYCAFNREFGYSANFAWSLSVGASVGDVDFDICNSSRQWSFNIERG